MLRLFPGGPAAEKHQHEQAHLRPPPQHLQVARPLKGLISKIPGTGGRRIEWEKMSVILTTILFIIERVIYLWTWTLMPVGRSASHNFLRRTGSFTLSFMLGIFYFRNRMFPQLESLSMFNYSRSEPYLDGQVSLLMDWLDLLMSQRLCSPSNALLKTCF